MSAITDTRLTPGMRIDDIQVIDRHRKDLGDIEALARSIDEVELLQPIVVTREGRLVAGQRRLEACKRLGWDAVPVAYAESLQDAVSLLKAERDENVCRKDMLPSEKAAIGEALYAIEAERAKERQREAGDRGRATRYGLGYDPEVITQRSGPSRDLVGEALGMHGTTYGDLRWAHKLANNPDVPEDHRAIGREALDEMDRKGHIKTTAERMRRKLRAKREAEETRQKAIGPEPHSEPGEKPADWVPASNEKGPKPAARRREIMRDLGSKGWTSQQIGEYLGMRDGRIREIARKEGIQIPADEALGVSKRTRTKIDSNRIVRETVGMFNGLELALDLVNFDELDPTEIPDWTASLSDGIRLLNRLNKQLKERVQ